MALRITCPVCSSSYSVSDDLRGKTIVCSSCINQIAIPAAGPPPVPAKAAAGDRNARGGPPPLPPVPTKSAITDRNGRRAPPPLPPEPRQERRVERDEDEDARATHRPRRRARRQEKGISPLVWVASGVGGVAVLGLIIGLILLLNRGTTAEAPPPDQPVQLANNPAPQGNAGPQAQAAPQPQPVLAPPVEPVPPAKEKEDGPALEGMEVYKKLLRSTVWIVSVQHNGALAGGPMQPPFGPPLGPGGGGGADNLAGSSWGGRETLAGYGPLSFDFQPGGRAVMHDADGVSGGNYVQNGGNVTLTFGGNVTYSGRINGQTMAGTASNGQTTWSWNVRRGAPASGGRNPGGGGGIAGMPQGPGGGGFPGMPNPGGFAGRPPGFPGPGGIVGRPPGFPNPGGIIGRPPGFPNPGGIIGRPPGFPNMQNPGGLPGIPAPPVPPGFQNFPVPQGAPPGAGIVTRQLVSTGTGSLIDTKQRLIVTNCHVVGDSPTVSIYFPEFDKKGDLVASRDSYKSKAGIPGRVVLREERIDLALVQLDRLPEGVKAVPLSNAKVYPAQQVHSVGNPGVSGALWVYSPGKVRQVFEDTWKVHDGLDRRVHTYKGWKIETDSPINPGDSGGPLVNDHGRLVGVAHASNLDAQNMSIFIDVREVRALIQRYYQTINQRWVPE